MTPVEKNGDQVLGNSPFGQEHLKNLVPEDRLQLFQVQGRSNPEHTPAVKASVRHQDMEVGIEPQEVAKGLDGDDPRREWDSSARPPPEERPSGIPRRIGSGRIEGPGHEKLAVVTADPTDKIFLECALEGKVDYIISGDEHLIDLKVYEGIPIIKARDFLLRERYYPTPEE